MRETKQSTVESELAIALSKCQKYKCEPHLLLQLSFFSQPSHWLAVFILPASLATLV